MVVWRGLSDWLPVRLSPVKEGEEERDTQEPLSAHRSHVACMGLISQAVIGDAERLKL